ncbi:MAG: hypothetical protein JWN34_1852 [Bryobacterales bacterium]|jgi:hypothetical protein|nr:hypothetical protein [Bryobacterales bacterium]
MTKKPAADKAVSAVQTPRAVRPSATRTTSVRHKKSAVSAEALVFETPVAVLAESVVEAPQENVHEAVAKIAFGYWAARGYQGGNAIEDWCRAEAEYHSRNAA